jgi:hypothetical protein
MSLCSHHTTFVSSSPTPACIDEAIREGWLGEVEGLQVSLASANDKLHQIDSTLHRQATITQLGLPTLHRHRRACLTGTLRMTGVARWDVTAAVAMQLSRAEYARSARSARVRHVLFLVRHAMPALSPETPPEQWQLGSAGRRGAETLRHVIPPDALLVSSQEPKALQTLEPTGHVFTDVRFNEVSRNEPSTGTFAHADAPTSTARTIQAGNHVSK